MRHASINATKYALTVAAVAICYFVAAKIGLRFAIPPGNATAVWPPSGIALAVILLLGYRTWPGIWVGSFLVNLTTNVSVAAAASFASGNTIEAILAAWLMKRFLETPPFRKIQDAFLFAAISTVCCIPAATVGAGSLWLEGTVTWPEFWSNWWTWWLGDIAGQVIFAAPILAVAGKRWSKMTPLRLVELVILFGLQGALSLLIFGGWLAEGLAENLLYLPMILLFWVCLRFSLVEVTASTVLFAIAAIGGTSSGLGAYGTEAIQQSLSDLQFLLMTYAVTGLGLTGIVVGRREAETAAGKSQQELRKEATERSRLETWFRQLLTSSPDALVVSNSDGEIVLVNDAVERLFGFSREELLGQPIEVLIPARYHEKHRGNREEYRASPRVRLMGTGIELVGARKDGTEFPAEVALGPMKTDDGLVVFSAIRDISSRKQAEKALRDSEERFDLAVRGTDAGIWDWDLRTDAVYFSPRWKSMLGFAEDEIRNEFPEWQSRIHPDDREKALTTVRDYLDGKVPEYELEHRLQHKDGSYRWILARGAVVRDAAGNPYRMAGSHLDITDRKRVQELALRREAQFIAAGKIQQRLLPQAAPEIPGFDIGGRCYPAEFAAGDYFDFLHLPDGSFVVVVGDVAGHGIGAAIVMGSIHAHLRLLSETDTDLSRIVTRANAALVQNSTEDRFVTLIAGRFDPESRTCSYVNAGHPPGFVLDQAGEVKFTLDSLNLPLTVLHNAEFSIGEPVQLNDGDIVVFLTDGLLETLSDDDKQFQLDRCIENVRKHRLKRAIEIVDSLYSAVCEYAGGKSLEDDVTIVVVKIGAEA